MKKLKHLDNIRNEIKELGDVPMNKILFYYFLGVFDTVILIGIIKYFF